MDILSRKVESLIENIYLKLYRVNQEKRIKYDPETTKDTHL